MQNKELIYQLRVAVLYIESMKDSIECGVNERGQEAIYGLMDKSLEFDIDAVKALLTQLEVESDE